MTVEVLKTFWGREAGRWTITGLDGFELAPSEGADPNFFRVDGAMKLRQGPPRGKSFEEIMNSFGSTEFFLKQSILPVVLIERGGSTVHCIGTAFVISCTGYVITAYHVIADAFEREPHRFRRNGSTIEIPEEIAMGVVIPVNPVVGGNQARFLQFERAHFWGTWRTSPLLHQPEEFIPIMDAAICKVSELPNGMAHQPLNLSRFPFIVNERAFAIGYSEMQDVPFEDRGGVVVTPEFSPTLFVSIGVVTEVFPDNHQSRAVPTPGPCFNYEALIPGKMSGSPIFGGDGAVVRGIVSRSFSGERHATGAMLSPVLEFPIRDAPTLRVMMDSGSEGIPRIQGPDRL